MATPFNLYKRVAPDAMQNLTSSNVAWQLVETMARKHPELRDVDVQTQLQEEVVAVFHEQYRNSVGDEERLPSTFQVSAGRANTVLRAIVNATMEVLVEQPSLLLADSDSLRDTIYTRFVTVLADIDAGADLRRMRREAARLKRREWLKQRLDACVESQPSTNFETKENES